jgi:hypothetical protein
MACPNAAAPAHRRAPPDEPRAREIARLSGRPDWRSALPSVDLPGLQGHKGRRLFSTAWVKATAVPRRPGGKIGHDHREARKRPRAFLTWTYAHESATNFDRRSAGWLEVPRFRSAEPGWPNGGKCQAVEQGWLATGQQRLAAGGAGRGATFILAGRGALGAAAGGEEAIRPEQGPFGLGEVVQREGARDEVKRPGRQARGGDTREVWSTPTPVRCHGPATAAAGPGKAVPGGPLRL